MTHILPIHNYNNKNDNYIISDNINENNIEKYVNEFIKWIKNKKQGIFQNNFMILLGEEFQFGINKDLTFRNIEKLKQYLESKSWTNSKNEDYYIDDKIEIFYSLPQNYYKSVFWKDKNNFPTIINKDFIPNFSRKDGRWNGFFNHKYYFKGLIRKSSNIFYDMENYFSIHRLLNFIGKINVSKYNYSEVAYNLEELKKILQLFYFKLIWNKQILILLLFYSLIKLKKWFSINYLNIIIWIYTINILSQQIGIQRDNFSKNNIEYLNSNISNVEKLLKENIENDYKINIGQICYINYIVNNTQCLNEFILTNENETQFNISIYNPNLQGINLISIEFNYIKNRYNLK